MNKLTLGIDIGGTFIKYALVDSAFNIIEKWKIPTVKCNTKDEFYDYICSNAKYLDEVDRIGVSAPGLVNEASEIKSYAAPNVVIMFGTSVNEEISKRTGKIVATINDAKSAGLCELKAGNAKGTKSSAFLIIGTGTGGCLCNEDDVIYGVDGFAGEFHHMPFIDFHENKVLRQGDYCSMTALIQIYNTKVSEDERLEYGHEITVKYLAGDEVAKLAIEDWTRNIANQLLSITTFYNPEIICLGGGISEEDWFIDLISERFKVASKNFLGLDILTTKIGRCKYNNDANILGAVIKVNMK